MTFPSEEYIGFCIKNKDRLPEWEPRIGDWFYTPQGKVHLLCPNNAWFIGAPKRFAEYNTPLFTLRQLITMLEERGYSSQLVIKADITLVNIFGEGLAGRFEEGPDPETALGRALMEVCAGGLDT